MRINNSVVVVTGAGDGIGREVALALRGRGAHVVAVDRNAAGLERTVEIAGADGPRLTTHVVDVTSDDDVAQLRTDALAAHGHVDAVVNVAGIIQRFVPVKDLSLDEIRKVMDVNFWGTVRMTTTFLPDLLARPEGAIVNVSSMGAIAPVPGQSAYGASKAAVKLFTEGLYAELVGTKVRATVVFPGAIGTKIAANSGAAVPGGHTDADAAGAKVTSPAEAGRQIADAVEKGPYRVLIGSDVRGLDKLARLSPRRATELIAKKMSALLS